MVTAILIPIICLYFYFLTRKEMKVHDEKWLKAGDVHHEAILTGAIQGILEEKQKFYLHRYILVQELKLQTDTKLIPIKTITPLTKNPDIKYFKTGDVIKVFGKWEGNQFYFNKYEIMEKIKR
jgi:hypothetical protein